MQRRLRGRWFSLVPTKRTTLMMVVGWVAAMTAALCFGHYAAVAWPSVADRPEIARALRLDRPDSFGRWFETALLSGCAGIALLIYQLRRYRLDDFRGHYRLWRVVLVVMLFASVNSVVSVIDWSGAILDATLGKRVALTGGNWIRLVVTLGGAMLSLRLIAEVWRSRWSLALMGCCCAAMALHEAAQWNIVSVDSITRWVIVTAAPVIAAALAFLSFGVYLRMLYREVREIDETDSLRDRFQRFRLRLFSRDSSADESDPQEEPEEAIRLLKESQPDRPKRWWRRSAKPDAEKKKPAARQDRDSSQRAAPATESTASASRSSRRDDAAQDAEPKKSSDRRRGLLRLRRGSEPTADEAGGGEAPPSRGDEADGKQPRRRRFSMRLKPPKPEREENETKSTEDAEENSGRKKRRFGLGLVGRKTDSGQGQADQPDDSASRAGKQPAAATTPVDVDVDDDFDGEDIDWAAMSKAERRRMRKKLKKRNRVA